MENPTPDQTVIFALLKLAPDTMYVTPDGNHIYILMTQDDVEGLLDIEYLHSEDGKRFDEMNPDELNTYVVEFLRKLIN
jgi:hypothetical protein